MADLCCGRATFCSPRKRLEPATIGPCSAISPGDASTSLSTRMPSFRSDPLRHVPALLVRRKVRAIQQDWEPTDDPLRASMDWRRPELAFRARSYRSWARPARRHAERQHAGGDHFFSGDGIRRRFRLAYRAWKAAGDHAERYPGFSDP